MENALLFKASFLFLFAILVGSANAETNVTTCQDMTVAGETYTMHANAAINGSTCFTIAAANITLDCNGYTTTGNDIVGTYGVYSDQFNTTVRNCNISDFDYGVLFKSNSYGKIQNTSAKSNTVQGLGIVMYMGATNHQIIDSTGISPRAGVAFYSDSSNNQIINSILIISFG